MDRDRDTAGRARNARPRDATGRPLPADSEGVAPADEDVELAPEQALCEAQRLIDQGYAFHAHEVLEATWKAAREPDRDLWQGLAQLAVGLTHGQRANSTGAAALLRRGAERIAPYAEQAPHGLDVSGLGEHATQLADRIERDGLAALPAEALHVQFRPG